MTGTSQIIAIPLLKNLGTRYEYSRGFTIAIKRSQVTAEMLITPESKIIAAKYPSTTYDGLNSVIGKSRLPVSRSDTARDRINQFVYVRRVLLKQTSVTITAFERTIRTDRAPRMMVR